MESTFNFFFSERAGALTEQQLEMLLAQQDNLHVRPEEFFFKAT